MINVDLLEKSLIYSMFENKDSREVALSKLQQEYFKNKSFGAIFTKIGERTAEDKVISYFDLGVEESAFSGATVLKPEGISENCKQLQTNYQARQLILKMAEFREKLLKNPNFLDEAKGELLQIVDDIPHEAICYNGARLADNGEEELDTPAEERMKNIHSSGFQSIDDALSGGFDSTDAVFIGARSGGGKTAFCQNLIYELAIRQGKRITYINTEMPIKQVSRRVMASSGVANYGEIRTTDLDENRKAEIKKYLAKFREKADNLWFIDDDCLTPDRLIAHVRREVRKGSRFIFIDYIQNMRLGGGKGYGKKDNYEILQEVSAFLKKIAKEYGVCIIALSQLNKEEKLSLASVMEWAFDAVMIIRKMEDKEIEKLESAMKSSGAWSDGLSQKFGWEFPFNTMISFSKCRNGAKSDCPMIFDGPHTKFWDYSGIIAKMLSDEKVRKAYEQEQADLKAAKKRQSELADLPAGAYKAGTVEKIEEKEQKQEETVETVETFEESELFTKEKYENDEVPF